MPDLLRFYKIFRLPLWAGGNGLSTLWVEFMQQELMRRRGAGACPCSW
ncbi:hypothetical protein [Kingella sp. (in: b-proteobacteria)]|nr:hypothetical protein [Kingella sp. (in: b-proteobacteria)]MDO4656269.1 hypothetical protein [Kingella sp. (in: b-proteobacteria)]